MMRKTALAVTVVMLASFTAAQPSQQGLMNPGQKPGDLLYGLDRASEALARAVASAPVIGSSELKSKVLANQAEERLAEANALAENNRSQRAEKLMDEYRKTLNRSISNAERANRTELSNRLENVTSKHVTVLQDVQRKVPEPAKAGIQNAIDNAEKSSRGLERARQARERTGKPEDTGPEGNRPVPQPDPSQPDNRSPEDTPDPDQTANQRLDDTGNAVNDVVENSDDSDPEENLSPGRSGNSNPDGNVPGFGR